MKRDLDRLRQQQFDLLVIGAGVHGACVARDAALRGLKVALIDKGDLCGATSFNSLKTIHGGVRYLSQLMKRFDNDLTLVIAAYNAGPGAVERAKGIPDKPETKRYVKKVMAAYQQFRNIRYGEN